MLSKSSVTENPAPVRGSVTPLLCLYIGASCPPNTGSPERQKQRFRFVTSSNLLPTLIFPATKANPLCHLFEVTLSNTTRLTRLKSGFEHFSQCHSFSIIFRSLIRVIMTRLLATECTSLPDDCKLGSAMGGKVDRITFNTLPFL
jgi:hypothetical protein